MTETAVEKTWVPLSHRERRVLGVLVEKAKTTPEYYPLSVAAVVTASNQKSNRDPVTNFDADDVEDVLEGLRRKGAVVRLEGAGGSRVIRWKHTLYEWLKVSKVELAVMAELMLRGPQTEGDLRARASRMEPIAELATLQELLEALASRGLIVSLSPKGRKRGMVVTHGLYPPDELEKVKQAQARANDLIDDEPISNSASAVRGSSSTASGGEETAGRGWRDEVAALRAELDALRNTVTALAAEVRDLKSALGA